MKRAATLSMFPMLLSPLLASATVCTTASGSRTIPLVELYTSEGCSDCPPADRWLSEIAVREEGEANFLAFHVDYWDEIGWPDRFASRLHTQRQQLRVSRAGERVIYTPQVMVGEEVTVSWRGGTSTDGNVNRVLQAARTGAAPVTLRMSHRMVGREAQVTLGVEGRLRDGDDAWVWLAVYEDALFSTVQAGENAGKRLRHDRVVRVLQGPWKFSRARLALDVRLALPQELDPERAGLVAFVESVSNGAPLQSLGSRLTECAGTAQS
ncbi:DUF1223 domain-containing protein [Luteimonas viscosa]|uniref:DUF1223 domain-containing protein n=1 Tax=Luteimonas viscosa TaxID=1132694 RepID=A0A5D4XGX4_9GAMM|nr:DUF1223 domain-containing protein [Luteimonas viscosa]TYT23151.1 DUF1223 domain-containing protein [Luteimonas viscosa]